ncbi:MAG: LptF/LptG family permease [Chlamydiia bacterium]|nr:LptF/LptG family permease [Chlamydiia bacterium]
MKLWRRYIFRHLIHAQIFFLLCLMLLYITVDLSINGASFLSKHAASWLDLGFYYSHQLAKLADLFLSFSFLLASLKVLIDLGGNRELTALQTSGLSTKKLLFPFFFLALITAVLSYCNSEWIVPNYQHPIRSSHTTQRIFSLPLSDGTELVYQSYDPKTSELFDVFWLRSPKDLWHMKTLRTSPVPVQGRCVDHFVRNRDCALEKTESASLRAFPELSWNTDAVLQRFIPFEERSLSALFKQTFSHTADQYKSGAHLHYKLGTPLLPLILLLGIAPPILRFSREKKTSLFVAISLFAFVGLTTLLDALLILSENCVLPAAPALWTPFVLALAITLPFFWRLK